MERGGGRGGGASKIGATKWKLDTILLDSEHAALSVVFFLYPTVILSIYFPQWQEDCRRVKRP